MITPQRYEIGCQLLLITNRKLHMAFRLVATSMTLNGIIALILHFSPNSIALLAKCVTVVEYRPILSPTSSLPPLAITNPPCDLTHLCAIAALLVYQDTSISHQKYSSFCVDRHTYSTICCGTAGPKVQSSLPDDITSASSLTMFRHKLKTHLFPQSYPDIIM